MLKSIMNPNPNIKMRYHFQIFIYKFILYIKITCGFWCWYFSSNNSVNIVSPATTFSVFAIVSFSVFSISLEVLCSSTPATILNSEDHHSSCFSISEAFCNGIGSFFVISSDTGSFSVHLWNCSGSSVSPTSKTLVTWSKKINMPWRWDKDRKGSIEKKNSEFYENNWLDTYCIGFQLLFTCSNYVRDVYFYLFRDLTKMGLSKWVMWLKRVIESLFFKIEILC